MTDDRAALEAAIAPLMGYVAQGDPTVEQQRDGNERFAADHLPVPPTATVTELELGGVSCQSVMDQGASPQTLLLYFHGGGYVIGSARAHRGFGAAFSRLSGMEVVLANYRLAPEHPGPAAVEDGVAVYRALLERRPASSIAIAGDSAGGGLALSALVAIREQGLPQPGAAVLFSPWTDLTFTGETLESNAAVDSMVTVPVIRPMAQAYIADGDPANPLLSPLFAEHHGLAPTLFICGSDEILLDDSRRVVDSIRAAGGLAEFVIWPRMLHVFATYAPLLPQTHCGWSALRQVAEFTQAHLTPLSASSS